MEKEKHYYTLTLTDADGSTWTVELRLPEREVWVQEDASGADTPVGWRFPLDEEDAL